MLRSPRRSTISDGSSHRARDSPSPQHLCLRLSPKRPDISTVALLLATSGLTFPLTSKSDCTCIVSMDRRCCTVLEVEQVRSAKGHEVTGRATWLHVLTAPINPAIGLLETKVESLVTSHPPRSTASYPVVSDSGLRTRERVEHRQAYILVISTRVANHRDSFRQSADCKLISDSP